MDYMPIARIILRYGVGLVIGAAQADMQRPHTKHDRRQRNLPRLIKPGPRHGGQPRPDQRCNPRRPEQRKKGDDRLNRAGCRSILCV